MTLRGILGLIGSTRSVIAVLFVASSAAAAFAQSAGKTDAQGSIGGAEHEMNIYGVRLGMDIPTALEAVFVNAGRKPGEEKPDAMRKEGKNDEDIRVLYNELPAGALQIVFAKGKYVKEVALTYSSRPSIESLRLAPSSDIGVASSGERFDDRYTIGFVDNKKQVKMWWRFEDADGGFGARLAFLSGNSLKDGQLWWQTLTQKAITVKPGDEKKFEKALGL